MAIKINTQELSIQKDTLSEIAYSSFQERRPEFTKVPKSIESIDKLVVDIYGKSGLVVNEVLNKGA